MATNQDFLKFSAYSIKDLITRKLSESSKFTDQVYEGSNLAVLIDIFSNMAQCLLYSLNNTAAESMFSDTLIYENINRLVKFIGYNPRGITTPTVSLTLDQKSLHTIYPERTEYLIYKYSAINTGKTDSNGRTVYYSTVDNYTTNSNDEFNALFYNGLWQLYHTVYNSDGNSYQKIILEDLGSDTENQKYIVNDMIHVYVQYNDVMTQYKRVSDGLFTDNNINNGSQIYNSTDKIFDLRLNEYKQYEITFGNGFSGYIPEKNALIYVFYLESNGSDGYIEPGEIENKYLIHDRSLFGISDELYKKIFNVLDIDIDKNTSQLTSLIYTSDALWKNNQSSTTFVKEEDVEDIRNNAPSWFKTGNRLITTDDFEYYVKNRFKDNIIDVKCLNNWQYISTFYQWLYDLSLNGLHVKLGKRTPIHNYYINQNRLLKYDLKYSDSADGNNVYLWIKMKNDSDLYTDIIDQELLEIKTITQEPVYVSPIVVQFSFCAADIDTAVNYLINDNIFDKNSESYLEITLDDDVLYSNNDIQQQVKNIIENFFNEDNFVLGQTLNFTDLTNKILAIGSINRIRTVYKSSTGLIKIISGISFASWSLSMIDIGDDMNISTTTRTLEVFLFPKLYNSENLISKIKVIKKSISNVNLIQY